MASRATFSASRLFLTSIRTTGPLRPPTNQIRTITSYPGLLGAAKLQSVVEMRYPEEKTSNGAFYEEAVERWQAEAQKVRETMLLRPEDLEAVAKVQVASRDQLSDLIESVIGDEVSDIRRGWVVFSNY